MARITTEDVFNVAYNINTEVDESTAEYIVENYERECVDFPLDSFYEGIERMIYQTREQ